jgi:hypothetical protein
MKNALSICHDSGSPELHGSLLWYPLGVGWYPVDTGIEPYNDTYFARYQSYADSDIGRALIRARCALVQRHYRGELIDVGIGCGTFIDNREQTYGWDICPAAIRWLNERNLLMNPYVDSTIPALSFWDVLEHIPNFQTMFYNRKWIFVSVPIFNNAVHALNSKHFRPDEHYWYFTRSGLIVIMASLGYELVEENDEETRIGREDIGSFVFKGE